MALTLNDVVTKLKHIDEVTLMEILEITSDDMVARFMDRIEIKYDKIIQEMEEDMEQGYDEGNEWWESDEDKYDDI